MSSNVWRSADVDHRSGMSITRRSIPPAPAKLPTKQPPAKPPRSAPDVNPVLTRWVSEGTRVALRLIGGEEVVGRLVRITRFELGIEEEGGEVVVFKHAVAAARRAASEH